MESLSKEWLCPFCKSDLREVLSMGPHSVTGKRFCPSCGEQIWTLCECGQGLRLDDKVCPKCGLANPIYIGSRK